MRVGVVLAAGASRRWGAGNKLFAPLGQRTLLACALAAARAAPVQRLVVVTGWQGARVTAEVRSHARRAIVVRAPMFREGLGASLRAAAAALRAIDREVLLFLADVPRVDARIVPRLTRARGEVVRPAWRGVPGHPVLLRGAARDALAQARGDAGPGRGRAAVLLAAGRSVVQDLDRPGQRRRLGTR